MSVQCSHHPHWASHRFLLGQWKPFQALWHNLSVFVSFFTIWNEKCPRLTLCIFFPRLRISHFFKKPFFFFFLSGEYFKTTVLACPKAVPHSASNLKVLAFYWRHVLFKVLSSMEVFHSIYETKNSAPSEFQPHLIRLLTWRQKHRPSDFKTLRKTQWPKASLLNLFPHSFKVVSSFYKFSLFIFRSKAEVVLQQRLPAPQRDFLYIFSHFKYKCLIQCLITAVIQYGFIADM